MGSPIGPLTDNKNDNEERSYTGTPDGKAARRVVLNSQLGPHGQAYGQVDVTPAVVQLLSPSLALRSRILLQNLGNKDVYLGFDNQVTVADGLLLPSSSMIEVPFGADLTLFGLADAVTTQDIRFWELA